jgi:hypothetical protein
MATCVQLKLSEDGAPDTSGRLPNDFAMAKSVGWPGTFVAATVRHVPIQPTACAVFESSDRGVCATTFKRCTECACIDGFF